MAAFTIRDALGGSIRILKAPGTDLFFQRKFTRERRDAAGARVLTRWPLRWDPNINPANEASRGNRNRSNEVPCHGSAGSTGKISLVFRRPSRACRRLLALPEPTEGVQPDDMMRQIRGEKLNVGSVLTWGPCYYYQKQFFRAGSPLSRPDGLMHYDLEVSGFPSSHAGHLVLLGLDQIRTIRIARGSSSGDLGSACVAMANHRSFSGFAHSGWGLAVKVARTSEL